MRIDNYNTKIRKYDSILKNVPENYVAHYNYLKIVLVVINTL